MQVGLVGLGKMGRGMSLRLVQAGHDVVGMDVSDQSRTAARESGARVVDSLRNLVDTLDAPRVIWVMLPAGALTRNTITSLSEQLEAGDLVIDGGNSDFRDAAGNRDVLGANDIEFVDVGVSGGQWGWKNGYGLMIGASATNFERIEPVLHALSAEGGYRSVGDVGSGHLVKAIHNGVQYAILQAYAEGYELLEAHPEVDSLSSVAAWQEGSSIRSWLLEQTLEALRENPTLADVSSRVTDSGMGRWTAEEAIRLGVPTPVLTTALYARFTSRTEGIAQRLLVAARGRVGGQQS